MRAERCVDAESVRDVSVFGQKGDATDPVPSPPERARSADLLFARRVCGAGRGLHGEHGGVVRAR
jgi:hypothetical protein